MTRPAGATLLPAGALVALAAGLLVRIAAPSAADTVWTAGLVLTGAPLVWRTLLALRSRRFAQPIAGLVIVLMQSGGELLEHYAAGRALEQAAPGTAHRVVAAGVRDDRRATRAPRARR